MLAAWNPLLPHGLHAVCQERRPSWLDRLIASSNHRPRAIASARSDQDRPCQKGFIPLGDVHQGALVAHQRLDGRGGQSDGANVSK
jgi:hypothetical protein